MKREILIKIGSWIVVMIGVLWAVYSGLANIFEFPTLGDWRWGLVSGVILVVGILGWKIVGLNYEKSERLKSLPALTVIEANTRNEQVLVVEENDITWNSTSGEIALFYNRSFQEINFRGRKIVQYAYIDIVNQPKKKGPNSTAHGVWADVKCMDLTRSSHWTWRGRWEGPAPNLLGPDRDIRELDKVSIEPSGLPRRLKLAFRDENENYFYGFTNTSYQFWDWKDPYLKICEGRYKITVTLSGDNFDDPVEWNFELLCRDNNLEIRKPIEITDNIKQGKT